MAFLDFNWKNSFSRGVIFFFLWQRSYCVMKKKNTIEKRVLHWTVCIFAKTRIRFSNIKFLCRRTSPCTQSDFVGHICQTLCGPFCHFWQDLCDILRFIEHTRYYGDGFVKSDHSLFFLLRVKDIVMRQAMSVKTVEREIEGKDRKEDYFI